MIDWAKPIVEKTSRRPAYFVGFSSQGYAIVEYCCNLYFVNSESGIRTGNQLFSEGINKDLTFVNPDYKPISSIEKAIPFIGKSIQQKECGLETLKIVSITVFNNDNFHFNTETYVGRIKGIITPRNAINYFTIEENEILGEKY